LNYDCVIKLLIMSIDWKKKVIKSPLRYPGGKGSLYPFFVETLKLNDTLGGKYYEPFAGGSGVGLALLSLGVISEMIINDYDYHIYSYWYSLLNENKRLVDAISAVDVTISEWHKQKNIYDNPDKFSVFEVGFSTFFLNRCNRSGIISGAGPIGGFAQNGKWLIDERFNKEGLIERTIEVGKLKKSISIYNQDAIVFLKEHFEKKPGKSFLYLDPPYVKAGNRLYLNLYKKKDHEELSDYLTTIRFLKWVLTYDSNDFVRALYRDLCSVKRFYKNYSLQNKVIGNELIITPKMMLLPEK